MQKRGRGYLTIASSAAPFFFCLQSLPASGSFQRWLDNITNSMAINLSKFQETVKDREAWRAAAHAVTKSQTWLSNGASLLDDTQLCCCLHTGFPGMGSQVHPGGTCSLPAFQSVCPISKPSFFPP